MENNKELLKSFKKLLLLETRARDIYSSILKSVGENTSAGEKICHIRDEEIGHMGLAEILVKMAESADSKKKKPELPEGTLKFVQNDFIFKKHLLKTIEESLNAKIQDFFLQEDLEKKTIRLEKKEKSRQESMRKILHDLKNPLTLTKWVSDWLLEEKKEKLTENQKEMIERIKNANQSMLSLIGEL